MSLSSLSFYSFLAKTHRPIAASVAKSPPNPFPAFIRRFATHSGVVARTFITPAIVDASVLSIGVSPFSNPSQFDPVSAAIPVDLPTPRDRNRTPLEADTKLAGVLEVCLIAAAVVADTIFLPPANTRRCLARRAACQYTTRQIHDNERGSR